MKNYRINRIDAASVVAGLPAISQLTKTSVSNEFDLFICSLGFEPRTVSVAERLAAIGVNAAAANYLVYSTNFADNKKNEERLLKSLKKMSAKPLPVQADASDFCEVFARILDVLDSDPKTGVPRVAVDISTMANRFVLSCIDILLEHDVDLTVLYAEAETYHPTQREYHQNSKGWREDDEISLEAGVLDVVVSRRHPGQHFDSLPQMSIVLPSFKKSRTAAVLNHIDPSIALSNDPRVIWLIGRPRLEENAWRMQLMQDLNDIPTEAIQHLVSTFDYRDTLLRLSEIHSDTCTRYLLTISPLGSKLQALGVAFFCYAYPDVRVMLAVPKRYNAKNFSDGVGELWRIHIGPTKKMRESLDSIDLLELRESRR